MKKLFSLMMAAFIGLTAFAAEEKSLCPAGTLADGKVTHELECCTIVQEQGESTTALKSVSPWQAPAKSVMTITPKEGVSIEQFIVNTKNTTLGTYIGKSELTNATKTATNNGLVTFAVTNGTEPVVMKFVSTTIKFCELTIIYTQEGGSVTPEPEDTTVVTPEPEPTVVYTVAGQPAALFGTEWDATNTANNMTLQADGTYKWEKADVELEAKKVEFKVVKDGNWSTSYPTAVGVNAEYTIAQKGKYDVTITFNPTTTDLAMNAVLDGDIVTPEPEDTTIVTPPTPAEIWTVAGSKSAFGTNWDPANTANIMTFQADGTYKWEKTELALPVGNIEFKVVKGAAWGEEYPSENYVLNITEQGLYTLTIVFNPATKNINAKATKVGTAEVKDEVSIAGEMTDWVEKAMTISEGVATITMALEAKDYLFKIVENGSWLTNADKITRETSSNVSLPIVGGMGNDITLVADVAGDYTFSWNLDKNTLTVTYPAAGEEPEDTTIVTPEPEPTVVYTVAGQPAALFGTEWDAANAANNMTLQADGTYKWEKADVELEAGKVEYKVVKDGNWNTSYPTAAGVNAEYTIAQKGKYDVTITFNPTTTDLAMNAVLDGDIVTPEPEDTTIVTPPIPAEIWTVAGSESAFGTKWDPANTANIMTAQADGTYKLEKTDLALPVGNIEFKVVKGAAWGEEYPSENYVLNITEQGLYTLVIVFDPATKNITASATKVGNAEVEDKVSIAGEMTDWVEKAMTISEGVATITMALEAKDYLFKIVENGSWLTNADKITRETSSNVSLPIVGGMGNDITLVADVAGDYTFSWNLDKKTLTVTYPAAGEEPGDDPVDPNPGDDPDQPENPDTPEQPEVTTISLAGTMNEWDMTANPFVVAEGEQTASLTIALEAATYEFKVVVDNKWLTNTGEMTRDNCTGWLFENLDGMGNNAKIVADVAGDYVFVWSIADSKLSVTYPVAGEEPGDEPVDPETAVDNVAVGEKAVKVIRNGQMYIIRNGVIYNAMGQIAE